MKAEKSLTLVLRALQPEVVPSPFLTHAVHTLCTAADSVSAIGGKVIVTNAIHKDWRAQAAEVISATDWEKTDSGATCVSLDARAITFTRSDLEEVAEAYLSQPEGIRRPIVCVEEVPSQFHPLKTLTLDGSGVLRHSCVEGRSVYQRQQVAADKYWVISPICWVGQALRQPDPHEALAYRLLWPQCAATDESGIALAERILRERRRVAHAVSISGSTTR